MSEEAGIPAGLEPKLTKAISEFFARTYDGESEADVLIDIIADAILADREELNRLREAIKPAYLGLLVLKTMCRKAGLQGGVEATESAMKSLVEAMPELPAISALRSGGGNAL